MEMKMLIIFLSQKKKKKNKKKPTAERRRRGMRISQNSGSLREGTAGPTFPW